MKELYIKASELGFIPDNRSIGWKGDPYLWMCELQMWLMSKYELHLYILPSADMDGNISYSCYLYETKVQYKKNWKAEDYKSKSVGYSLTSYEESLKKGLITTLELI